MSFVVAITASLSQYENLDQLEVLSPEKNLMLGTSGFAFPVTAHEEETHLKRPVGPLAYKDVAVTL